MAFDFKTATPESAISDSNLLFGAASFGSANPTVFPVSTLRTLLIGGGTLVIPTGKTFTVNETMTLTALAAGQTFTFPAVGGTVALLNAANLFTTANTFSPITDVAAGTFRRSAVGSTSNILQIQDEANNNLATFGPNGYLTLGRASSVTGQAVFANATNANTVTVQAGTTSSSWSLTLPTSAGTADYALVTNGSGASSWSQVNLASAVTGTLPVGNGGTGQTSLTAHGVVIGNATNGVNVTSAGTAGQFLVSGGASADPTWTTATFPTTAGAAGTILRSNGTNWLASSDTWPDTTSAGTILVSATANTITATASPTIGVAGTTAGSLGLAGGTSGTVTINVAATAGTWSLTLPTSGGTSGYLLKTDGTGVSSWFNLFGTANTWSANQTFSAVTYLADGSATAPSLAFTNSTTTGLYRYGANAIGVAINGAYAAQIDASGNVMIGTADDGASGANTLTLAGSGNAGMTIRTGATSTGSIYFSDATTGSGELDGFIQYDQNIQALKLGTASNERLRITYTGNIYPTTTPSTTMTDGFIYIPSGSGPPTGVPANIVGFVPQYYDSTNNYLYVYNGTWKRVSFADNFLTQE
jgi:hypothetical protein